MNKRSNWEYSVTYDDRKPVSIRPEATLAADRDKLRYTLGDAKPGYYLWPQDPRVPGNGAD